MNDSYARFVQLRHSLANCRAGASDSGQTFTLGAKVVDARLGGGLLRSALHEIYAAQAGDMVAANGFALMLALRARGVAAGKPILWLRGDRAMRRHGRIYGPGLVELGADPDQFWLISAPDDLALLRAAGDAIGCAGLGTLILEIGGKARLLDLTATRRLALGAARSGVMALLIRSEAQPVPSAATTRWQVAAAPSQPLAANAPGHPCLAVSLLRHRSGRPGFETIMEWNRDEQSFRETPLYCPVPAAAPGGQAQAAWRLAS